MAFTVTGQGFRMAYLTQPTLFLQSFCESKVPPSPTVAEAKAAELHPVEIMKDSVEGVVVEEQG